MKKLLLILILPFFLAGCTSYTELNQLSIVNTLGIDYLDGEYHLTLNVIEGELDDKHIDKDLTTYNSKQKNLDEAFQDIYLKSDKRLYLSHIDLLLLSENAVNEKLVDIIQNFLNNNEYRNNFKVILLKNTKIEEFLNEKIQAEDMNNMIKTNWQETSMSYQKDLETLMKELLIDKNSYLPTLSYKDNELEVEGFTLIKEFKIYEQLSLKESILFNILNNHTIKTFIDNTNIYNNQTTILTNKNKIRFRIIMTINGNTNNNKSNIQKDLESLLKKYQDKDYDILKLTEHIRKNDYKYYKNQKNLLKNLVFNFDIKTIKKENDIKGGIINE